MKKNVYEILDEFQKAKSETDKRQILVNNATPDFVAFLQLAFDPRIKFVLKETPQYKPSNVPAGMGYTNMGNAIKKTYLFIDGHPRRSPNLTEEKTKELLINILEGLEAREAEMFVAMVHKKVKIPGLTKALLEKTFQGIFEVKINV
jgi:hypothetical protein